MKVTINFEKKYAYVIIGLLVLATSVLLVNALAPGETPNPGHNIQSIGPPTECADGQVLQFINETNGWGCVNMTVDTDTSGRLDCIIRITKGNNPVQTAYCPSGYHMTGGGCSTYTSSPMNLITSAPEGNYWWCHWKGDDLGTIKTAYARCCRIV